MDHSIRRRKRRDLHEEVVANSSSDEGKGDPEGEMVNTSGNFFCFGFDMWDILVCRDRVMMWCI